MKKILVVALSLVILTTLVFGVSAAMAAKPQTSGSGKDVIALSNGFPSGMHFNLNIHGKDPVVFSCDDMTQGGNSVFIDLRGPGTIEYVSNKNRGPGSKSDPYDPFDPYTLSVLEPCAMNDGTARVYLPSKVVVDGAVQDAEGYYVFAKILGKPNNGSDCECKPKDCPPSSITLYPNVVTQACSDPSGDMLDCEYALGVIMQQDIYIATEEGYVRFDPAVTKGKGKSTATDITRLFTWSGWVFYGGSPDANQDGVISDGTVVIDSTTYPSDIPADVLSWVPAADLDSSGDVDLYEWQTIHSDFDGDGDADIDDLTAAQAGAVGKYDSPYNPSYVPDLDLSGTISLAEWKAWHPDYNGDGSLTNDDLTAAETDGIVTLLVSNGWDTNKDNAISLEEWLEYHESIGTCTHIETPTWIFDIMDLVVTQQPIDNDGTRLLQVRFYPVSTTTYTGPGYIVVDKVTVPPSVDTYNFTLTGGPDSINQTFELADADDPYDSGRLKAGTYTVTEIPDNWPLSNIEILDPDGGSSINISTRTATIDLDPGEVVIVIFTNTEP